MSDCALSLENAIRAAFGREGFEHYWCVWHVLRAWYGKVTALVSRLSPSPCKMATDPNPTCQIRGDASQRSTASIRKDAQADVHQLVYTRTITDYHQQREAFELKYAAQPAFLAYVRKQWFGRESLWAIAFRTVSLAGS